MIDREEAIAIFERAASLLEAVGWRQGLPNPSDPYETTHCLVASLLEAYPWSGESPPMVNPRLWWQSMTYLFDAIALEIGTDSRGGSLSKWNDEPGRTADEVIIALRNAKRHL